MTGLPTRIARLFTVNGHRPGRDFAVLKFAIRMLRGDDVPLYAAGKATRDYTYVADIVDGLTRMADTGIADVVANLGSHRPTRTCHWSESSKRSWASKHASTCSRPKPAMCRRRSPTLTGLAMFSVGARQPASTTG